MNKKIKSPIPTLTIITVALIALLIIVFVCAGCGKQQPAEHETHSAYVVAKVVNKPQTINNQELEKDNKEDVKKNLKSNEEIAQEVINGEWGQGIERYDALVAAGYDADAIQKIVDNTAVQEEVKEDAYNSGFEFNDNSGVSNWSDGFYYSEDAGPLNPYVGVVYFNGHKETYYSQRVLPGDGLDIPGRHVAGDGTIRDGAGYICVAADPSYLPYGSLVETSLGAAKVYDSGCDYGTIDIYTNW